MNLIPAPLYALNPLNQPDDPRRVPPPASYLRKLAVFGGLNPEQLGYVRDLLVRHDFDAGEELCREGDSAGEMYVVVTGTADVLKRSPATGQQRRLTTIGPGGCVGEMALLDCQPRSVTVRATTACRTFVITWDALLRLYQRDLLTYTLIMMNLARELSRRLRSANGRLADSLPPEDPAAEDDEGS